MESNTGNGKSTRKGVKPTLLVGVKMILWILMGIRMTPSGSYLGRVSKRLLLLQGGFKMTPFGSLSWRENILGFSKYAHLWSFSVIPQGMVGLISLSFELELGQMTSTHC